MEDCIRLAQEPNGLGHEYKKKELTGDICWLGVVYNRWVFVVGLVGLCSSCSWWLEVFVPGVLINVTVLWCWWHL